MRRAILMSLLWLVAAEAASQAPPHEIERLAWFEGRWEGVSGGISMEEHWTSLRGGALLGLHRDVEAGRIVSFEFLRIQATPEGIVYEGPKRGKTVSEEWVWTKTRHQ